MGKIYVPTTGVDDWKRLLADPEKHWKKGFSARSLAYCWEETKDLPSGVRKVFDQSEFDELTGLEVLIAIPEHKVPLPGGSRPSQNDVWVLARGAKDLVSIAVEGKVLEEFGPTLRKRKGGAKRLECLLDLLELDAPPDDIRYQLIHRTASAIIEAHRFNAANAVMLVHSFSQEDMWFDDYNNFVGLFSSTGLPNSITSVGQRAGVSLYFGWVRGEERYLRM